MAFQEQVPELHKEPEVLEILKKLPGNEPNSPVFDVSIQVHKYIEIYGY